MPGVDILLILYNSLRYLEIGQLHENYSRSH